MENLLKKIEDLREKFLETWKLLDIDRKKLKIEGRRLQINDPDFWNNREKAVEITREMDEREKEINEWDGLRSEIRSLEELVAMAQEENDDSLAQEVDKKYEELKNKYEKLEFLGFAEKMNWKAEALDRTAGSEAGIKNTMIHIKGRWAYGYLKSESGVHRLVRISPFDAEAMRHTSFALVEVIPELPETVEIEISDSDLKVDVYRSSGPGGQSVNTTDSAVRMTHLPSGITVSCQNERSQHQNRETALKAEWGKQIRSYVMQPYKMVKDHRTNHETQDIDGVLNGNLESFMEEYLRWIRK